ncbi:MAG: hypothetical protein EAX95_04565 [Candidatus Thorarchaeota archaeon]|nr:hypothetical protein [Candidatus Thorarchaeota archaeon]
MDIVTWPEACLGCGIQNAQLTRYSIAHSEKHLPFISVTGIMTIMSLELVLFLCPKCIDASTPLLRELQRKIEKRKAVELWTLLVLEGIIIALFLSGIIDAWVRGIGFLVFVLSSCAVIVAACNNRSEDERGRLLISPYIGLKKEKKSFVFYFRSGSYMKHFMLANLTASCQQHPDPGVFLP